MSRDIGQHLQLLCKNETNFIYFVVVVVFSFPFCFCFSCHCRRGERIIRKGEGGKSRRGGETRKKENKRMSENERKLPQNNEKE